MGKRSASTRPSDAPQDNMADLAVREKPTTSHKRRTSSTSQAGKSDTTMEKALKSSLENKERAYVAASRRMDRSLEDRIKSAYQASAVHFERTGKHFRITRENVEKGLWYDEIDDVPRHRLNEHHMGAEARARYQEVDDAFNQVFGRMMPAYPYSSRPAMPYQFSTGYQPPYPVQQPLSAYPLMPQESQPMSYSAQQAQAAVVPQEQAPSLSFLSKQAPSLDSMPYPYGLNKPPSRQPSGRRSVSPASSSSLASWEAATSVTPDSLSSSSNPTSPESEIDSSAAGALASTSRSTSFDHFNMSSPSMPPQGDVGFTSFSVSRPSSDASILDQAGVMDPELRSPPTAYFADLSFEDMAAAYPDLGGFNFQAPPPVVDNTKNETFGGSGTAPAVTEENNWDDLIDVARFEEPAAAQGAQGWAKQG
ncbi:hypothetical protein QBC36DRAFT_89456 [Triangularia setosa]|uniref:Uncharacterized protein n=1 Tax=Triangularia setosa TaxID=2587417 RepID=A0AAN7A2J0_9PEZI|nr:hypothetical protein QBC36DRAFT_89456 [Podospora setosa]